MAERKYRVTLRINELRRVPRLEELLLPGLLDPQMSFVESNRQPATAKEAIVDWKLEVVTIPVTDMDRARDFYAEQMGFNVDIDQPVSEDIRFLQLTPRGSACSIHLGPGTELLKPGSLEGLFLVVPDVKAAREDLVKRGVEVGEVLVFDSGEYRPSREGESLDLVGVVFVRDPDGNRWMVQQIPPRE